MNQKEIHIRSRSFIRSGIHSLSGLMLARPFLLILLATSEFMIGYWWAILAAIAACAILFRQYANTPAGRTRIDGLTAKPAGELVQHEAGGDVGGVDGASGRAAAGLCFRLPKKGCGVVIAAHFIRHHQHPDHFAKHPRVGPELAS